MRWRPALHWASVGGRARADAGPVLLAAVVVVVVTLLAGAVPPLLRRAADAAVQDTVRRADEDAAVVAYGSWSFYDDTADGGRVRAPQLSGALDEVRRLAADALDPALRAVTRPPIGVVTSPTLKVTDGSALRTFRLTYLAGAPAVTWIDGGPPAATGPPEDREVVVPPTAPPWPVQVGLSEVAAQALAVRPGDVIPLQDEQRHVKVVRVSGVFRPVDPADAAWRLAPELLGPYAAGGATGYTRFGGLLSAESLPDARLAFERDVFLPTVWFAAEPGTFTLGALDGIVAATVALEGSSGSSSGVDTSLKWQSRLDVVLRGVRAEVNAAYAQASVLLAGLIAVALLVLLLAADLLVRRRAPALAAARQRGASLPDLVGELLLESAVVVLVATGLGLALAGAVVGGAPAWEWVVPVAGTALIAGPGLGVFTAARATRDRRVPANRSARRWIERTRRWRRAGLEVAVVAAAVGAIVALRQRGIGSSESTVDLLAVGAPVLGVLAGAVVLSWLLPLGTRAGLAAALRSRRPLAVFGAARAVATSTRRLGLLTLVTSAAVASLAFSLGATTERGLADGAWRTVGGDVRLDLGPEAAGTAELAQRLAAAPGVRGAVAAQITDGAQIVADAGGAAPRLVVVDAAAWRGFLATTPLPDVPDLAHLAATGGEVPALVRSADGTLHPGARLELRRDDAPAIRLVAVGVAPVVGDIEDVVVVDAAAFRAAGGTVAPNTVWVTGPGAGPAVGNQTVVVRRAEVLRERREAPLTAGLLRLAGVGAGAVLALGLLGLALSAATGTPDRWLTLTRLRTLGLRPRDVRRVAAGELAPPVVLAAVGGPMLGVLVAGLTLGPLDLGRLTGSTGEPVVTVLWWLLGLIAVLLVAAVALVVPVEAWLRRRHGLAEVLRAGGG